MPDRSSTIVNRLLLSALCLFCQFAAAQEERWYQVELIVFSNAAGGTAEQWEATPELEYPGAARFLIDPARVKNNEQEYAGVSRIDGDGRQLISAPTTFGAATSSTEIPVRTPNTASTQTAVEAETEVEPDADTAGPQPFTLLPTGQQTFRGKAAYMEKTGRYKILFHETWVQPIGPRAQARPIVLDHSGDTGQWSELQGTITLYRSRYLHLETNLWVNTDGSYLENEWRMPPPPLGPPSLVIAPSATIKPEPVVADVNVYDLHTQEEPIDLTVSEQELGPVYPYRHAVALRQSRRMRSDEVHYIDHPMLGAIIKVTPLGN